MAKISSGYWAKCSNCGGRYHVKENGVVDKYCKCLSGVQRGAKRTLRRLH